MSITNNIIHNTQMSTLLSFSKIISSKEVCFLIIDKEGNHSENPLDEIFFEGGLRGQPCTKRSIHHEN